MKKTKKLVLFLLCFLFVQVSIGLAGTAKPVEAATTKSGLVESGSNYYYYSKGKKITNRFAYVTVGKDSQGNKLYKKMYFGSTGAAYKATTSQGFVVKKAADGKNYGFNTKGYLLSKGLYVGKKSGKFYYFNSNGSYNSSVSSAFNKSAIYGKSHTKTAALLKKYGIKPKKTTKNSTCYPDPKYTGGKDYTYYFTNFTLGTCKDKYGKNEIFMYAESK